MEFMTHNSNPTHNTQKTNFASLAHLTLQRQTINVAATATWKAAEPVPHLSPKWLSKNEHSQLKTQCECWVESQATLFCLFLLLHMPETKKKHGRVRWSPHKKQCISVLLWIKHMICPKIVWFFPSMSKMHKEKNKFLGCFCWDPCNRFKRVPKIGV